MSGKGAARRILLEVVGWTLVLVGIAALVLPGPGLLALFAGLAVLSQQYEWAERRVRPVEEAAKKAAADSVQTWPRIIASLLGVMWLVGLGIYWGIRPPAPEWWPLKDDYWLVGGWGTGGTLIGSAFIALGMIIFSFRKFRGKPEDQIDAEVQASSRG